ncbi:MAG: DUF885 domain-containing protein [Verrucomicrobiales bacterium]
MTLPSKKSKPNLNRCPQPGRSKTPESLTLRKVALDYFEQRWELFPQEASFAGFASCDALLNSRDPQKQKQALELGARALTQLETIVGDKLEHDDWVDRRLFLSMLRCEQLGTGQLNQAARNPQLQVDEAVESIFSLVLKSKGQLKRQLPAIRSRLKALPNYLEESLAVIRSPLPLWSDLAQKSCTGAIKFLEDLRPALSQLDTAIASTLDLAQTAFRNYASRLQRRALAEPETLAMGEHNFLFLVRERLGLDLSLHEIEQIAHQGIAEIHEQMRSLAKQLSKKSVDALLEESGQVWESDAPALLEAYTQATYNLRDRLAATGLAQPPPGETLSVMATPAFMKHHFPTAAYSSPPAFSADQEGIFWVNDLSLDETTAAGRRRERLQHFGIELTTVHEAYPGHHLQFCHQNQHPSFLRRMASHAIYYEGWTLWCEDWCLREGLVDEPWLKVLGLHDRLWRAHRVLIDCGLQTGRMSVAQAVKHLMQNLGFSRARAQNDVNWYTSSPTVPMSYYLGWRSMRSLHQRLVVGQGWSLAEFHRWILSFGAVPYTWILRETPQRVA